MIKLFLFFSIAWSAFAQCGVNGSLVLNPITGQLDCTGKTGAAGYTATVTATTGISVTAATHGQGTKPVGFCYDNATPANLIAQTAGYPTVAVNGDMVFAWTGNKTGYCLISALGNQVGPAGAAGPSGSAGATGATGPSGPAGPAPSGTGTVVVTAGVAGLASGTSSNCVHVDGSSGTCGSGSGVAPYYSSLYTSQTSATITSGTHGFTTTPCALAVMVYDNSSPRQLLAPDGSPPLSVDPTNCTVVVKFASATTFYVAINGGTGPAGAAGPSGPSGAAGGTIASVTTPICGDGAGAGVACLPSQMSATNYAAGGGTAQTQTVTLSPAATSQSAGLRVCWLPTAANTGAGPTLAVNGLTAKSITKYGTTALIAGDLSTSVVACAIYDGTQYQLLNPQTNPSATIDTAVLNGTVSFCADAGANDSYACTLSPAPTAYVTGARYRFSANTANTGAASINFNSLGAKTIKKAAGGVTTDLADNDIRVGQVVDVVYDGTNMQMQSTLGNAATGSGQTTPTNGAWGEWLFGYPNNGGGGLSNQVSTTDVYLYSYTPSYPMTIGHLVAYCKTGAASASFIIGLYSTAGTKLWETNSFSCTSSNTQSNQAPTGGAQNLTQGTTYYLAMSTSGGTAGFGSFNFGDALGMYTQLNTYPYVAYCNGQQSNFANSAGSILPSSCTVATKSGIYFPVLLARP